MTNQTDRQLQYWRQSVHDWRLNKGLPWAGDLISRASLYNIYSKDARDAAQYVLDHSDSTNPARDIAKAVMDIADRRGADRRVIVCNDHLIEAWDSENKETFHHPNRRTATRRASTNG